MGYYDVERPPNKYDAAYFKAMSERLRVAINYLNNQNFPNGIDGALLKDGTVKLASLAQEVIDALSALPVGGTTGQALVKASNADYDVEWGSPVGSDKTYTHYQDTAATVWNVVHNLGKYPSVTIEDSAGNVGQGNITYVSTNELTITLSAAMGGKAHCN